MNVRHKRLLFLCSGNYYRSRFAEILFNDIATRDGHDWRADSRGFRLSPNNVGPISRHAVEGLRRLGIAVNGDGRVPIQLTEIDLAAADHVVAVKEAEHRAMMEERFPSWVEHVEFWHIDDIDCAEPKDALLELERQVVELLDALQRSRQHV